MSVMLLRSPCFASTSVFKGEPGILRRASVLVHSENRRKGSGAPSRGASRRCTTIMSAQSFKYVVLGGGNASGYAAWEFVKRGGKKDEMAIVTSEPVVAYERPALSKAYLFPEKPARLPGFHTTVGGGGQKQELAWYKEHGIEYLTDTHVNSVDLSKKTLTSDKGDISFEKLVIATGARPIYMTDFGTKGADLKGLYYLRNVTDADKLVAAIPDAKAAGGKAVVIGGGYIGLETGAAMAMNGLDVTIVFPEGRFMERLFTPEIAGFYERFYESKGIKIKRNSTAEAFEGKDGQVTHTVLKGGEKIESDLVIVGVGARPNIELFKGQVELLNERPGGIKVDSHLQTSMPGVYAVGDVAAFPLLRYGQVTRQEHVQNCRTSAQHAVAELMGESSDYDYLPYFYSRIFSLSWQLYGVNPADATPVFWGDTSLDKPKFGTYWVDKDSKVVGAFLEGGSPEETAAIKKVAAQQPAAPPDLASQGITFAAKL